MHKILGNLPFQSLFLYWVGQVSIVKWIQPVKIGKIMKSRPTLWSKLIYFIQHFSNDKEKFISVLIEHIQVYFTSLPFQVPSGRVGFLYLNWSTEWCGFESCYWLFVRMKYAFFHWFENQYFCCYFKVVLLMLFNNK